MATIPRTYLTTSKSNLSNIPYKNGQIISVWDSDEVWYDAPNDGTMNGAPVRRKISGVRVVDTLPNDPMEGIAYIYIGDHGYIPDPVDPDNPQLLYDIRVYVNGSWLVVGNNLDDTTVRTMVSDNKFYVVGAPNATDNVVTALRKNSNVYIQDGELYGTLKGNADTATNATNATNAGTAQVAIKDSNSNPILSYFRDASIDNSGVGSSILTLKRGSNADPLSLSIKDTTYDVFTSSSAGLVNKTSTTVNSDSTGLILSGSGWISTSNITMPSATSATSDGVGQNIANTYIKALSYNTTTDQLTITQGDNQTSTISIPNTEYGVFDTSNDGLVPAASTTGDTAKFLRGDGTWQAITTSNYQGATSGASGIAGLVPPAASGQTNAFLRGDATWGGIFDTSNNGLVPAPTAADSNKFLKGDGTWAEDTDTKNTAGATDNTNDKLFVIGAPNQNSNPQTYSNVNVYVDGNKLYSNNAEVVDLSSTQALTNKTYNGYTLDDACASSVATTLSNIKSQTDEFTGDGSEVNFTLTETALNIISVYVADTLVDPSNYSFASNTITFGTAPQSGDSIEITYTITDTDYDADALTPTSKVVDYISNKMTEVATDIYTKLSCTSVAPMYDNTSTYAVDDFCMYEGDDSINLYRCTTAVTSAEDFDDSKWTETTVIEAIKYLISQI